MTTIDVPSIQGAVSTGKLIELSNDYRTSSTVRSFLPKDATYAISTAAFRQYVHQDLAGNRQVRLQAFCVSLSEALGANRKPSPADFEFRFVGEHRQPQSCRLKREWYAASKCWVVLLPDEQIRPVAAR